MKSKSIATEAILKLKPHLLWRLLRLAPWCTLEFRRDELTLRDGSRVASIDCFTRLHWRIDGRFITTTSLLDDTGTTLLVLNGFSAQQISAARLQYETHHHARVAAVTTSLDTNKLLIQRAMAQLANLVSVSTFSSFQDVKSWLNDFSGLRSIAEIPPAIAMSAAAIDIQPLAEAFARLPELVRRTNDMHVEDVLANFKRFALGSPTDQQKNATIRNEDNTLVIAAAGSGKTALIIQKASYLVRAGIASPSEILVLAFNRKAADELRMRLSEAGVTGVACSTFHAFGLQIVGAGRGSKPDISPLAEKAAALSEWIERLIRDRASSIGRDALRFVIEHRYPWEDDIGYKRRAEYVEARSRSELRTLHGERVKSHGELTIADALWEYGIEYTYEQPYAHEVTGPDRKRYRPDFHIGDGIYIEYWGVDRAGRTRGDIDAAKYAQEMQWKRQIHAKHGTRLIELYYFEHAEGRLRSTLFQALADNHVVFNRRTPEQLSALVESTHAPGAFADLLARFLSLFKGGNGALNKHENTAAARAKDLRIAAFMGVFQGVLKAYDKHLKTRGEIDFNDMIGLALEGLESGAYRSPYRFILVDEFQDVSTLRAQFVRALREQVGGSRLFCVGDDWQSINQFAGSDISVFKSFEKFVGAGYDELQLTQTHRFPLDLARMSTAFVTRNPEQTRKLVTSEVPPGKSKPVFIRIVSPHQTREFISTVVAAHRAQSVAFLGRYKAQEPAVLPPEVQFSTIHAAKGKEYDIVIVDTRAVGPLTFPSAIADDPILRLVLPPTEHHPFAEERRLFYVALTRARHRVYVISDEPRSAFVSELLSAEYSEWIDRLDPTSTDTVHCPSCEIGVLTSRKSGEREFLGCSMFPYCDHTEPKRKQSDG